MTAPTPSGGYKVQLNGDAAKELRAALDRARERGRLEEAQEALLRVHEALQLRPFEAGEPLRSRPRTRSHRRRFAVAPLAVEYIVAEGHPFVWIVRVGLMGTDTTADGAP